MTPSSSLFSVVGKNVLVTGGSRGIGFMIAKGFVQAGANVILTSRDEKACSNAVTTILKNEGGNCRYVTSTLSTRQGCETLAENVQRMLPDGGRLDVLINNAGTSWGEDPWNNFELSEDKISSASKRANFGFDKVLDLNVKSVFYLTRACVPLLLQQQRKKEDPGRVINIGSVAGLIPQAVPTHAYDISKAAVHHLTKKLASDLASHSITVNALAPGYVPSRMSRGLLSYNKSNSSTAEEQMNSMAQNIPLGRLGNEDDMVGACLYFTSRAGSWCTGVILNVDGGQVGTTQLNVSSNL